MDEAAAALEAALELVGPENVPALSRGELAELAESYPEFIRDVCPACRKTLVHAPDCLRRKLQASGAK